MVHPAAGGPQSKLHVEVSHLESAVEVDLSGAVDGVVAAVELEEVRGVGAASAGGGAEDEPLGARPSVLSHPPSSSASPPPRTSHVDDFPPKYPVRS